MRRQNCRAKFSFIYSQILVMPCIMVLEVEIPVQFRLCYLFMEDHMQVHRVLISLFFISLLRRVNCFYNSFSELFYLVIVLRFSFCFTGFGVIIVNYSGSLGCGNNYVHALLGKIGSLDVTDCYITLQKSFEKFQWLDNKNVMIFGGSHGGFLATHLSAQYPVIFSPF